MGWDMTKIFFNIIYFYYWIISCILFVGKNNVNRVKRPYICSNWPKTVKKTSFWPQNDVIHRNRGKYDKKAFSTISTLTIETSNIYFLWVKTKLKGSKVHISVQIVRKRPKWRHFGHKMTSYVEIGVRYDENFFSILSTFTTDLSHIYFFG